MITQLLQRFNLKSTLVQCAILLSIFALLACLDLGSFALQGYTGFMLMILMTVGVSHIVQTHAPLIGFQTVNLYISYMLLFLLIHPIHSSLWLIFAGLVLIAQKYLLRPAIRIFNPTAFALLITYLASTITHALGWTDTLLISWWGTDMIQSEIFTTGLLRIIIPSLLLIGCVYFVMSFHKVLLASTFFMTFTAGVLMHDLSTTFSSTASLTFITASFFNAIAFMTCIMICEPKTSPAFTKHQALIGVLGGGLLYLLTRTPASTFAIADPLITTILLVNLITYPLKKYGILK